MDNKKSPSYKYTKKGVIEPAFIEEVRSRLLEGQRVRRKLPYDGWLNIDRNLPFLIVHRQPTRRNDEGTHRLAKGEASYLVASGAILFRQSLKQLVRIIVENGTSKFGAFLIIELWSNDNLNGNGTELNLRGPKFRIITSTTRPPTQTVESLKDALKRIKVNKLTSSVEILYQSNRTPPKMKPLISVVDARNLNCYIIGLEVSSMYRNQQTGDLYPLAFRRLHLGLSSALKKAAFTFARRQTSMRPKHYQALGKKALVSSVWKIDKLLADIDSQFNFLLLITPVNVEQAWTKFKKSKFNKVPEFYYRLRPVDPAILKRELYKIPIENIEDPLIASMFREKRMEINRKLTMLEDRNTPQFFQGSIQLYGGISYELKALAENILMNVKPHSRNGQRKSFLDANDFANRALEEFDFFRNQYPGMAASVEIRDDIVGLMVVSGNLLISKDSKIPISRVEALIQHEVGTHVLTYYNGKSQPFRQLYCGMPGYEELQEGLAVMAEYLVGGLSRPRLRLLAGRVVASQLLIDKASFIETFRKLNIDYGFNTRTAFTITLRTYRGGGLTKDSVYLRGLMQLLAYLNNGGNLEKLYIGKIALEHLPLIEELEWRGVLHAPPIRPRFLFKEKLSEKISMLRNIKSVMDLI